MTEKNTTPVEKEIKAQPAKPSPRKVEKAKKEESKTLYERQQAFLDNQN